MSERFVHNRYINDEKKYSEIYFYLDKYITEDIFCYTDEDVSNKDYFLNRIWIMWLQGMDNAPQIVKQCIRSIERNKPTDFEIIILTEQNIREYISLPQYVIDKYKRGIISRTHLSDIIRLELLSKYGGCWIDATVYCMNKIPVFMMSDEIFMFKLGAVITDPVIKVSSWWIYAKPNNRIIVGARNLILNYWKSEEEMKDYFLLHLCISKMVDMDSECRAIFNKMSYFNSGNAHVLQGKLGTTYTRTAWECLEQISPIQKLSYKKRFLIGDNNNFYEKIVGECDD